MNKSHVGMGAEICPVCGNAHSEAVLLHKQLREVFENGKTEFIGWNLCPVHERMKAEYVALVEVEEEPNGVNPIATAKRTGQIAHVRRIAYSKLFKGDLPPEVLAFVCIGVIDKLRGMVPAAETTTQQLQTDVENAEAEKAKFESIGDGSPTGEPGT